MLIFYFFPFLIDFICCLLHDNVVHIWKFNICTYYIWIWHKKMYSTVAKCRQICYHSFRIFTRIY